MTASTSASAQLGGVVDAGSGPARHCQPVDSGFGDVEALVDDVVSVTTAMPTTT
jgi:hypothetical protein